MMHLLITLIEVFLVYLRENLFHFRFWHTGGTFPAHKVWLFTLNGLFRSSDSIAVLLRSFPAPVRTILAERVLIFKDEKNTSMPVWNKISLFGYVTQGAGLYGNEAPLDFWTGQRMILKTQVGEI